MSSTFHFKKKKIIFGIFVVWRFNLQTLTILWLIGQLSYFIAVVNNLFDSATLFYMEMEVKSLSPAVVELVCIIQDLPLSSQTRNER